ncbi:MAG: 23S rRNA (adenine(2503)-C(2))-methyltransferase RlmN [Desulfobacteraceae bacterium]|nr:MAG: 23S rRNA (adenine(2503)-C(2))-methyltransferase RlmN [Desulfobacteraceae bacterium]
MIIKNDIKDLTKSELILWLQDKGIRSFRAGQIFKWIFLGQADTFDIMTDIGKDTRNLLSSHFIIERLFIPAIEESRDGSKKFLFRLADGNHIETVLIPEKNHHTLCISTQVGCAQNCKFCLTAKGGFIRNLTPGEILAQIRDVRNTMDHPEFLKNVVLMGMGEPLANYDNVIKALDTMRDADHGLKISARKITISTAGLISKFAALGRDTDVNLAISLNASDNKTRSMLMPINQKYPIEDLIQACRRYPLAPREKITFEYILIKGVNDSSDDADRLIQLLRSVKAKINLIPFNEHPESDWKRPDDQVVDQFLQRLHDAGYTAIIRYSKGLDISAACGQLRANRIQNND